MRIANLIALMLIAPFFSSACGQDAATAAGMPRPEQLMDLYERSVNKDAFEFDIVQRTCALYVALRSGALESPAVFGSDLDEITPHWNMCPGGTTVACMAPAIGDSTRTGIPFPY